MLKGMIFAVKNRFDAIQEPECHPEKLEGMMKEAKVAHMSVAQKVPETFVGIIPSATSGVFAIISGTTTSCSPVHVT